MNIEMLESRCLFASVIGLVLVNADTAADIAPLISGATLNLATLPTRHLNVRADATADTESVKFRLDGSSHVENLAPYTLAGNDGNVYFAWTPAVGSHALAATAYTRNNAKGTGGQVAVTFVVIDQPNGDPTPPSGGGGGTGDATPPSIPGVWKLNFADEFNDDSPDGWRSNIWWNPSGSAGGNIGDETTSPSAVTVAGGNLNLTATKTGPNPYTSGLVTTDGNYAFTYGYAEARMQIPSGQGMWPAFWLLPASHNDGKGEIDAMEVVGDEPWMLHMNYHVSGPGDGARSTNVGYDLSQAYHTFAVDWEKNSIAWYLDGKEMYRVSNRTNEPMYLILNLAVGGTWPGSPDATTQFPSTMKVEYVHVWQKTG